MKKSKAIVVIGGGGHAKVVVGLLKKMNCFDILGYTDKADLGPLLGVTWLGNDSCLTSVLKNYPDCQAALGIGSVDLSSNRAKVMRAIEAMGLFFPPVVSPSAIVNEGVRLGPGTVVMDGAVIQPGTQIGKGCIVNTRSVVEHDCLVGDDVHIAPGVVLCGGVEVGSGSFIGAHSTVIPYKRIAPLVLIGAGSLVLDVCGEPGTYFGIPAQKQSPVYG